MDENSTSHDGISTAEELEESLVQLLRSAYENGVSIETSYEIRNGQAVPDWEVLIHKLAKKGPD
ncbi:hypothetical protein RH831_04245 [Halodesulfurarchaeum sp. HSR-GB]|uniref:hypothetical protein n=1 Tax=Halodesulfurarchaeum sp. HSR-GB TaxID=3074077 RepID=UPI002862DE8C|nr:hypothetical protein [Halodesulfurarchaeum sp. HSR-GB]MDR5656390.1 hypothetical protein [Halodesulfurarchaeum sp. HSR-GB]